MVVCLEQGAHLHMAQLMPLPLTVSCFSKIQIGFTFLVPAQPGSPGRSAIKRVCVCVFLTYLLPYLSSSLTIDPLHFQTGCCKRRLNLAAFFVLILCSHMFCYACIFDSVVLDLGFICNVSVCIFVFFSVLT